MTPLFSFLSSFTKKYIFLILFIMVMASLSLNLISNQKIQKLSKRVNQLVKSQENINIVFSTLVSEYSVQSFEIDPNNKSNTGAFIRISGMLSYDMKKQFISVVNQTIAKGYEIQAIHIKDVDGGFIKVGSFIGKFVADNNIRVIVSGRCYSACNLIFMFSKNRIAEHDSEFGFHGHNDSPDAKKATERIVKNYLTNVLNIKDQNLIDKMFINKNDVEIIPVKTLHKVGYITEILNHRVNSQ